MPTYEFRCPNGHSFDQIHRITAVPSTVVCPTCGAEAVQAISGGAGLVFKGSGFYLTDYGKNAHRTNGPAAKGGESGGGGGGGDGASSAAKSDSGGSASSGGSEKSAPAAPSTGSASAGSSTPKSSE